MNKFKINDRGITFAKLQIYSSNTHALKKGIGYITEHYLQKNLSSGRGGVSRRRKRRACMGLPLLRMYGQVTHD